MEEQNNRGLLAVMLKYRDCVGLKFGRLTVLSDPLNGKNGRRISARCECGVVKQFCLYSLLNGDTRSCGCLKFETQFKHGLTNSHTYFIWSGIVQRCTNRKHPNYGNYGGRGIEICNSWLKFENFYSDLGIIPKNKELDRIDNNKGYCKRNVRVTTRQINMENTKSSKFWYINGFRFPSKSKAAKFFKVTTVTITHWCHGWTRYNSSKYYPPKKNCYSELKYK